MIPSDIRPASFRGIAFEAREAGFTTGRRVIVHEYPQGENGPGTEDNGRATRRWRLQAFLVGDGPTVRANKRKLIEACEQRGPGTLVHPTEGTLRVQCESCDVTESSDGVNYAEFALTFVESGTVIEPVAVPTRARSIGDQLRDAVRTFYAARLQVLSVARKVNRLLTGDLEDRFVAMLELAGVMSGEDMSDYVYAVRVLADTYETGVDDANQLAEDWQDAFDKLLGTDDARKVADTLGDTFTTSAASYPLSGGTDTDAIIVANRYHTDLMAYSSALARASELAAVDDYASYDDAIAVSADLGDRLADLEGHFDGNPDVYGALVDVRRTMTAAILETAMNLPRLRTLSVEQPSLALVLSYDLYGDASRATEIIDRNGIDDPNAVTGDLLVLTE